MWRIDGQGIFRGNADGFSLGVRPRFDVCICQFAKRSPPRVAAAHGLWYVAVPKLDAEQVATHPHAWRDYAPNVEWLRELWDAHMLPHGMYLDMSA